MHFFYSSSSKLISLSLVAFLIASTHVSAENSFEFELDPYYTNAGYYISLTDEPIPEITYNNEGNIYSDMVDSISSVPRFFLVEASINPLPMAGVYLKKHNSNFYNKNQITDQLNIVQALTEGFEEPYALSFFLGSVVRFVKPGESENINNRGYTGYLLSIGDQHIVNNNQVDDDWLEFEFKIKGDQKFAHKSLSWSLRAGVKVHSNPNITDVLHFGLRRNHLDTTITDFGFIDNSDIDYKIELNKDTYELVEQEFFISKKWHVGLTEKSVFSFGVGFVVENNKYSGVLSTSASDFRIILRPNLSF